MFLDQLRPVLAQLRSTFKETVTLLAVVFSALVGIRVLLTFVQADPVTGLAPDAIWRLNSIDGGLLLIGLGVAVLIANTRWSAALEEVVNLGIRTDDELDRLKRHRPEQGGLETDLVARLTQDLDRSAQGAANASSSASPELQARVARVARESRRLVDVVQPSMPGYSMLVDRFRLRNLVHQARDLAQSPERLTVSILIRDDVPDTLTGDGPKILRALAHLIGIAGQHVDGDALFVTVSGEVQRADVALAMEVRGDRHVNSHPSNDSIGLRAAAAMARGLGGRLAISVRAEDGLRYTIYAPVARSETEELEASADWDAVENEVEAWSLTQTKSIPVSLSANDDFDDLDDSPTSEWVPVREPADSEWELPVARLPASFARVQAPVYEDEDTIPVKPMSQWSDQDFHESPAELASRRFAQELETRRDLEATQDWSIASAVAPIAETLGLDESQTLRLTDTDIDYLEPEEFYPAAPVFEPEPVRLVRRTTGTTPVVESSQGGGRLAGNTTRAADIGTDPLVAEQRVLVVDDDAMARWSMTGQLSIYGFVVDAVASGRTALEALERRKYAAVVLDTNMPEMNGFETAARIRSKEGDGPYIPLIAVSAQSSPDEHARCLAVGVNELIHKPVDGEQLAMIVDRLGQHGLEAPPITPEALATPAEPSRGRGLDLDVIERLERIQRVSDQTDLVHRMVDTFAAKANGAFDAFELGLDERDPSLVRMTADRLRRSCATLGIVGMERICDQLADETRSTGVTRVRDYIDELDIEYRRVIPLLRVRASARRQAEA
ncbi:MAG: CheY-like chemotaxis protein [Bradymonadia bacterium]|jgi:CheY-like chemotaxis protein